MSFTFSSAFAVTELEELEAARPWVKSQYIQLKMIGSKIKNRFNIENSEFKSSKLGQEYLKLSRYLKLSDNLYACTPNDKIQELTGHRDSLIKHLALVAENTKTIQETSYSNQRSLTERADLTTKLLESYLVTNIKSYVNYLYQYEYKSFQKITKNFNSSTEIVAKLCTQEEVNICGKETEEKLEKLALSFIKEVKTSRRERFDDREQIAHLINSEVNKLNQKLTGFDLLYKKINDTWAQLSSEERDQNSKKEILEKEWDQKYQEYSNYFGKVLLTHPTLLVGTDTLQSPKKFGSIRREKIGFFRKIFLKDTADLKVTRKNYFRGLTKIDYIPHNYVNKDDVEEAINDLNNSYEMVFKESINKINSINEAKNKISKRLHGHSKRVATKKLTGLINSSAGLQIIASPQSTAEFLFHHPEYTSTICRAFEFKKNQIDKDNGHHMKTAILGGVSFLGMATAGVLAILSAPVTVTSGIAISALSLGLGVSVVDVPTLINHSKRYQSEENAIKTGYINATADIENTDELRELQLKIDETKLYTTISLGAVFLDVIAFGEVMKSVRFGSRLSKMIKESAAEKKLSKELNFTIATLTKNPNSQNLFKRMLKTYGQKSVSEFTIFLSQTPKQFQKALAKEMSQFSYRDGFSTVFTRALDTAFNSSEKFDYTLAYEFRNFLNKSGIATDIPVERVEVLVEAQHFVRTFDFATEYSVNSSHRSLLLDLVAIKRAQIIDEIIPAGMSRAEFLSSLRYRPEDLAEIERQSIKQVEGLTKRVCKR